MTDMVKKYVPYAVIILLVYMLLPLVFIPSAMQKFSPVAYDFVFPITAIGCSAHYCSKHGLDFLFALIAPIIYLPSMLIYNGGFSSSTLSTNLILLVVYLVAGIFGLFLGDLAFGDKRRQKEKAEQEEAEEMLLEAKRREKEELENMTSSSKKSERKAPYRQDASLHADRRLHRRKSKQQMTMILIMTSTFPVLTESKIRTKAKLTIS